MNNKLFLILLKNHGKSGNVLCTVNNVPNNSFLKINELKTNKLFAEEQM